MCIQLLEYIIMTFSQTRYVLIYNRALFKLIFIRLICLFFYISMSFIQSNIEINYITVACIMPV